MAVKGIEPEYLSLCWRVNRSSPYQVNSSITDVASRGEILEIMAQSSITGTQEHLIVPPILGH
jgi:hypothetical protein